MSNKNLTTIDWIDINSTWTVGKLHDTKEIVITQYRPATKALNSEGIYFDLTIENQWVCRPHLRDTDIRKFVSRLKSNRARTPAEKMQILLLNEE
jgi:hypothetical protein